MNQFLKHSRDGRGPSFSRHGLLLLIAMLTLFSCSDQDFDDPNNPSIEGDAADVKSMITGIESGMREELDIYLQVVSIFGRDAYYLETADPRYTQELIQGPIDNGGFLVTRPWRERYRVIRTCNVLFDKLPTFNITEAERAGAEGFARTVLAYQLLLNVNYTDTNGLIIDVAGDTPGPVVSKEEGFSFIASQLDQALGSLQSAGDSFGFTLSSGWAEYDTPPAFMQVNRALKARLEAYRGNWQACLDALDGSFVSTERSLSSGVFHSYSQAPGDLLNPIFENQAAGTIRWLGHPSVETDADPNDARFQSKIFKRPNIISLDGLSSDLGITIAASNVADFPIIRNEELLLLRAEANINLGNLGAAQGDIDFIRQSHGLDSVALTDANAIDQLLFERRYSLYAEGHRWIDMRRYGRLGQLPLDRAGDTVIERMPIPSSE